MPDNSQLANLEFPDGGIDVSGEFQEQPPGTTPEAVNVRGVNPDSLRERGGSRAGLSQYIPGRVPSGLGVIQHLNVIVDPQADRLPQVFITPGDDWLPDPLNPGYFYPPDGSGVPINPNAPQPEPPEETGFVQKVNDLIGDAAGLPSGVMTLTFSASVAVDDLLVVFVGTEQFDQDGSDGNLGVSVTVKNSIGTSYTQAGSYFSAASDNGSGGEFFYRRLSIWYRIATDAANDSVVKITVTPAIPPDNPTDYVGLYCAALEYTGISTSSPLNDVDGVTTGSDVQRVVPAVDASTDDLLITAIFRMSNPAPTTPSSTIRIAVAVSPVIVSDIFPLSTSTSIQFDFPSDTSAIAAASVTFHNE